MTVCRRGSAGEVLLSVRVMPGASRESVGGSWCGPDGQERLILRVTAPAEDGRANTAICALLARTLGLSKSAIALASGEKARNKTMRFEGDDACLRRVEALARGEGTDA